MVCARCGSENRSNRRFCRECGFSLAPICPNCGAANEPADKFCGDCGADLNGVSQRDEIDDGASLRRDPHERRFVAVLFADLAGSTQFAEGRDPEIVRTALTAYYSRARDVIERFGGNVEKFIGDAVMAVWGAIVSHENDAERAVRAGLELTEMVARLGDELDGERLSLRVGIMTGEASVDPSTPEQGLVVGDLVNTASRLQSAAEPGTVVVGEATYRLLRDAVEFQSLGEQPLKGKAEPVSMWRAVGLRRDRGGAAEGGWEPPFVGRREELHLLKDALHATERAGRSRLISIIGEAGIGKTRLAGELQKYAAGLSQDVYWHHGRSPAYDQRLTFWAVAEMVRQRAGIADVDDPQLSRMKLRTAVAEYVSSDADREWIEPPLAAVLGLDCDSTGEQGEFFAAVRGFFQHISARGVTVLVFEDFHWADPGLVDFVRELVEFSPHHPILAVTLARPDLLDGTPGWGSGRRNYTSAHLGPLTDGEMSELVGGMIEGPANDLVDTIIERASGIPLYAVELIRMLVADGVLVMGDDVCCTPTRDLTSIPVPDTIRAVVEARLDRLAPEIRAVLQDAAVLGSALSRDGLAAMTGLSSSNLEKTLESLVRRELLEHEQDPRSPQRGQYRFVQSMIREVAYGRLTREERKVRHIRAARFFAELGEIGLAAAVASHLMAAHRVTTKPDEAAVLAAEAIAALADAAARAARMHSHAQVLDLVDQALAISDDSISDAPLRLRAAQSASVLARHEESIAYARQALDSYEQRGEADNAADAAALLGEVLCSAYRPVEAIRVLEPLLQADQALSGPPWVRAGAQLARAYLLALRNEEAAATAERVSGPAEQLGLVATIVDTMTTRGTALGNLGRPHEAIALLQGARRYAEDHDLPFVQMRAANNVGHLLAFDDHAGAMEACRYGFELADRLGDVRFAVSFGWAVASYLARDGRFADARALRDDIRDRFELPPEASLWYEVADLSERVEQGDDAAVDAAFDAVARSLDSENPQSATGVPVARGKLDVITGRFEDAYEGVMAVAAPHRFPEHYEIAAVAAAMLSDSARLERVADGLKSSPARGRMVGAVGNAVSGSLAALRGDVDEAVTRFTGALSFPYLRLDRARIQAVFATLVGRDVEAARRASDDAFEVLTTSGARADLDVFAVGLPPHEDRLAAGG